MKLNETRGGHGKSFEGGFLRSGNGEGMQITVTDRTPINRYMRRMIEAETRKNR